MPQDQRGRLEQVQIATNLKMARWTMIVGIFAIVATCVAALTGGFTFWQAYTAARVAEETREQLRAVMQFTGTQPYPSLNEGGKQTFGFTSSFQNFGGTRASDVAMWHSVEYFAGAVPNNVDLSKSNRLLETAPSVVVGAGASVALAPIALVNSDDFERAVRREGVLLIWGRATYTDIFYRKTRSLSFCQQIVPTKAIDGSFSWAISPFRANCNTAD